MNDKTIAEIIGWSPKFIEGRTWWVPPRWAHTSVAAPTPHGAEVSCDDMLAWLHARNLQFGAMSFADRTGVSWGVSEWAEPPSVGEEVVDGHSPTLYAALEAAVRAVHDAEEAQ